MWVTPGKTSCSRREKATTSSSPLNIKEENKVSSPSPRPRASTKREAFCRREIMKMSPICKSSKRDDDHVIPFNWSKREEEIDLDKQFGKGQVFDDKDSMWLSSDNYSPSSFFEDYRLSGSLHTSVDDWLVTWLSTLASSYLNLDKGDAGSKKVKLKLNPEVKSLSNYQDSSASCSLTSSASPSATTSEAAGFDGASLLVSLLDLDDVDYSERVLKLNCFPSGFHSPSCGSIWSSSEAGSSPSCNVSKTTSDGNLEGINQSSNSPDSIASDLDSYEPIFWPFERELEWSSEKPWSRFSISPRRDTLALPMSRGSESDARESCRRRLKWDSNSADPEILQTRGKNRNNVKKRAHHRTPPRPREPVEVPIPKGTNLVDGSMILEDSSTASGKHPIEALLGLNEFDGHEGVGSDFNCHSFDLH